MSLGMMMGRPLKYGEPLTPRQFRLPVSLSEKVDKRAKLEKINVSDIVISALETYLGTTTGVPLTSEDVRNAVMQALQEAKLPSIAVSDEVMHEEATRRVNAKIADNKARKRKAS